MNVNEELQNLIKTLKETDYKTLSRSEDFGKEYNFKIAAETLKQISQDLQTVVENADLIRIPKKDEDRILTIAKRVKERIGQINAFKVKENEANANNQHRDIHNSVEGLYQEDLEFLVPLIERAEIKKLRPTEIDSEITEALKSAKQIKNLLTEAEKTKGNLDTTIKEVRDALGTEGAVFSGKDFENQAIEHKKVGEKWLIASVVSIVLFLGIATLLFWLPQLKLQASEKDYARITQVSLFKIVVLSIGYLVVYQCVKNYKINQHLYVLNRHRQLTLSVYNLMTKATSDPEQSHIILGQATKAIFDPGTTGYLDGDINPNPVNLTGIVNKIAEKQ